MSEKPDACCEHPASSHTDVSGRTQCIGNRNLCPCPGDQPDLDYDYVGPDEWGTYPEDDDPSACIDADGVEWPEHAFGVIECKRCGAEAE